MKLFFAAVLFFPLFSLAQDCALKKETNSFTHETRLTTGFMPFSNTLLSVDATATDIDFFFSINQTGSAKCFDDASTAVIVFDGNRYKTTLHNTGSMNCEGLFHFTFKNSTATPYMLQRLATQKVSTITFNGSNKGITVITLSDEQKQLLMDLAGCVAKEAKTLKK